MLFVANRIFTVRKIVVTGVVLFLASACATMHSPASARKVPDQHGTTVHITVKDEGGRAVKNAVVYAVFKEHPSPTKRKTAVKSHSQSRKQHAVIVLADGAFHPYVLAIQAGSRISFLNRDRVQHHIYSISAAKKIDVPLNKGASSAPVRLNKSGIIVLGCAIDDQMVGYVYVLDYEHFSLTNAEGTAELAGLPPRAVEIRLWHPSMANSSQEIIKRIVPSSEGGEDVDFVISLQGGTSHESPAPASRIKQR